MKKILYLITVLFLSINFGFSQQINKKLTVVEISTGTWCGYCPGAAMGADDLLAEYGNNVAIIEHHIYGLSKDAKGDPFSYWGNLRRDYYHFTGAPIAYFDGVESGCGGSANTSMFPCYQPKYLDAIDDLTSFDIDLQVNTTDYNTFDITITIDKVANYSSADPVLHLVLIESHIQYNWQNQTELNFVNRRMYPDQNGTQLDFSGDNHQVVNISFTKESAWNINNCELVAFIQNWGTKQILNGDKSGLLPAVGFNNVEASQITIPSDSTICSSTFTPKVRIKNMGQDNLTSCNIEYSLLDGTSHTKNWVGTLGFGQSATVTLDEITSNLAKDTLTVTLSNPNGNTDDNLDDNITKKGFYVAKETTTTVKMQMNTGKWGWEISWRLQKTNGDTIYSGGGEDNPYTQFQEVNETFNLDLSTCYIFSVDDWDYGNGFDDATGFVKLSDYYDVELFNEIGLFGNFSSYLLKPTEQTSGITNISENNIKIFPNPTNGVFNLTVSARNDLLSSDEGGQSNVIITNITGKTIKQFSIINNKSTIINLQNQPAGIYFIKIRTENNIITKKIIKQ